MLPDKLELSLFIELFRVSWRFALALRARSAASCCAFTLLESGRRIVGFRLTLICGLGFVVLTGFGLGGVGLGLGFVILTGFGLGGVGFVCVVVGGVTDTFGDKI